MRWLLVLLGATAGCDLVFSVGSGPAACELIDDFDEDLLSTATWRVESSGAGILPTVVAGQLVMRLPPAPDEGQTSVVTRRSWDLTDHAIEVELAQAPALVIDTDAELFVHDGDYAPWIAIGVYNGELSFDTSAFPPEQTTTYDPVAHRWLRIRHETSTDAPAPNAFVFETSPDGVAWDQHTITSGFPVTQIFVELYAKTNAPVTSPGEARFDNVRWCP